MLHTAIMALLVIASIIYLGLFLRFLVGVILPDYKKYFQVMFKGYKTSTLRFPFRALILFVEYVAGLITLVFLFSSYYPAIWIRIAIRKLLISEKRELQEQEEINYNKTKQKLKD